MVSGVICTFLCLWFCIVRLRCFGLKALQLSHFCGLVTFWVCWEQKLYHDPAGWRKVARRLWSRFRVDWLSCNFSSKSVRFAKDSDRTSIPSSPAAPEEAFQQNKPKRVKTKSADILFACVKTNQIWLDDVPWIYRQKVCWCPWCQELRVTALVLLGWIRVLGFSRVSTWLRLGNEPRRRLRNVFAMTWLLI